MKLPIIPPNPRDVGGSLYPKTSAWSANVTARAANKTYNISSNIEVRRYARSLGFEYLDNTQLVQAPAENRLEALLGASWKMTRRRGPHY